MEEIMVAITGVVGKYKFESFEGAIKRLAKWLEDDLITEKQLMSYIMELYNQIPEETYNSIINEM